MNFWVVLRKNHGEKDQITAVTFENPGTKPIVEKMYKEAGLPENSAKKLNFCAFNHSTPHLLNCDGNMTL